MTFVVVLSSRTPVGSHSYWEIHVIKGMSQKKRAAIDKHQRGAFFSGRGGWKHPGVDKRRSSPRREVHNLGAYGRPTEEAAGAAAQTITRKTFSLRVRRKRSRVALGRRGVVVPQVTRRREGGELLKIWLDYYRHREWYYLHWN